MKRIAKPISLTIAFITILFTLSACNPFDNGSTAYLTKKMDEIPIEFEGYEISETQGSKIIKEFEGTVVIDNVLVCINKQTGSYGDYKIIINNNEILVDNEFMRQKSEIYVQIHSLWLNYKKINSKYNQIEGSSRIYSIFAFDNNLFIVTNGLHFSWTQKVNVIGFYPVTLYRYDIKNDSVMYAGYCKDYTNGDDKTLKIMNRGEAL